MPQRCLIAIACIALMFAACGTGKNDAASSPAAVASPQETGTPSAEASPAASARFDGPQLSANFPGQGGAVVGSSIRFTIIVNAFELVERFGDEPKEGQGHIVYYLDVEKIPTKAGVPALVDDENAYAVSAEIEHTWQNVKPGKHKLGAQLVNNDNTPLEPPVTTEIDVTLLKHAPTPSAG